MTNADAKNDVVYKEARDIYDTKLERLAENKMARGALIREAKSVSGEILKVEFLGEDRKGGKNDKVKESDAGNLDKTSGKEHAGIPPRR